MSLDLRTLSDALDPVFARPVEAPLTDAEFNTLALRAFAFQCERNAPYGAWCRRRGRGPDAVEHWTAIPALPTAAFKEVTLAAGDPARAEAVFRTSGTTGGDGRRGTHHVLDLSLYHRSLLPNFRAMVLPDGVRPAVFSLVPPAEEWPESSLAHMVTTVSNRFGSERSEGFASVRDGLDVARLITALRRAESEREPACLLGTSFSFVHALDAFDERGERFRLPAGSRLMDTGGFKGRSRSVTEVQMRARYADVLGVPAAFTVNEYGMTEMCSQFYDTPLRDTVLAGQAGPRRKRVPPWVRSRVVDPDTLEPLEPGRVGLLQHFDLANIGSVIAIQTEDVGVAVGDGFRVIGRATDAQPRGCSIAMDELMAATRGTRP